MHLNGIPPVQLNFNYTEIKIVIEKQLLLY